MLNKYLFLLLTLLLLQTATQAQTPLTTAPDITVKTLKGDIIQLYSLLAENKVVVIDFFQHLADHVKHSHTIFRKLTKALVLTKVMFFSGNKLQWNKCRCGFLRLFVQHHASQLFRA